jgi:adenosylhomocysteine nucleosidase
MILHPEACHFGVVFALAIEAGGLQDRLAGLITLRGRGFLVRSGDLADRRVVLVQSGPGRANAAQATESLLDGHRPAMVISAGFAGGLDPQLRRGDILLADQLLDEAGGQWDIDRRFLTAPAAHGVYVGRLLTVDRVVRAPEEKLALGRRHAATACDMETLAVAEVCRRREVPLAAVRVINDAADDTLPPDVEKLLAQPTAAARLGAALGSILKRPSSLKDLLLLQHRAMQASERLAEFLTAMISSKSLELRT